MYRIVYNPTSATIANSSSWRTAAAALRAHAAHHCDHTYNIICADPAAILYVATMGDDTYTIQRDECDLAPCDTCGDYLGMVTSQSNDMRATGSWEVACCTPCAQTWEDNHPREAIDFTSYDISRTVLEALNPKRCNGEDHTIGAYSITRVTLSSVDTDCPDCGGYGITGVGEVCKHCITCAD